MRVRLRRPSYPWVAMGVVVLGAYPFVLNITVLGVALPQIAEDLGQHSALGVDWVVTAYLVAVSTVQPGTGWMADRWGKRRVYVTALGVFAVGTVVAGAAPTMELLVVGRVIQGFGGGAMMPIGLAMIFEVFPPHRRGFALGIWGIAIMAGPALGPPLGGWVTTSWTWRWIFWAMVPVVVLALEGSRRLLRDIGDLEPRRIDLPSWGLATIGLGALIVASREATTWGIGSPRTIGVCLLAVITLGGFVRRGLRHATPLIPLEIFRVRAFSISMVVVGLLAVAQYARLTFLPIELQVVQGRDAAQVGLLLAPSALGVAAMMPLGGWLADRIGARVPVVAGFSLMTASMWMLAHLTPETGGGEIVGILVLSGIGTGLATMPTTVVAMSALATRYVSQASAVTSLNRQVTAAMGTALLAAFIVARLGAVVPERTSAEVIAAAQQTYNSVFLIAFWFLVATTVASLLLPGRSAMRALQAARTDEHERLAR